MRVVLVIAVLLTQTNERARNAAVLNRPGPDTPSKRGFYAAHGLQTPANGETRSLKATHAQAPLYICIPKCWAWVALDRKSTRLNSSHLGISYAVFCLKKKKTTTQKKH